MNNTDILPEKEKLKLALKTGGFGTWEWNLLNNTIKGSETLEKLYGFKDRNRKITFEEFQSVIYRDDKEIFARKIKDALTTSSKFKVEYRILTPDGEFRWLRSTGIVVNNETGKSIKIFGVCMDITSKKQTEKKLRAHYIISRELAGALSLRQVSQKILKIIAKNFDWQIGVLWLVNESSQKLHFEELWIDKNERIDISKKDIVFTFKKGQGLVGKAWQEGKLLWLEDIERLVLERKREFFKKAGIRSVFVFPIVSDRKVVGVLEFLSTHRRKKDKITISLLDTIKNSVTQVLERQIIQKEKTLASKQLEIVLRSVPFGVTLENKKGQILYANTEFAQVFGLKNPEEVLGKNIKEIFDKYKIFDQDGILLKFENRPAAKVFKGADEHSETLLFKHKITKDELWLSIRVSAVKLSGQKVDLVIKSYKDMTKMIEDQKQKEIYFGFVSHEFKNPLASIKAFIELLKIKLQSQSYDKIPEYIKNVEIQIDRLTKIIKDFLDITRLRSGEFQLNKREFKIDETIDKVIETFKLTAKEYVFVLEGRYNISFQGDEDRIVQVLINLMQNAIVHSEKGKKIIVKRSIEGNTLIISIKDSGIGIPQKYHKEIFKLFRSIPWPKHKNDKGLGLGLPISQAIIRSHGGELLVESKVNKGAEFIIKLPLHN